MQRCATRPRSSAAGRRCGRASGWSRPRASPRASPISSRSPARASSNVTLVPAATPPLPRGRGPQPRGPRTIGRRSEHSRPLGSRREASVSAMPQPNGARPSLGETARRRWVRGRRARVQNRGRGVDAAPRTRGPGTPRIVERGKAFRPPPQRGPRLAESQVDFALSIALRSVEREFEGRFGDVGSGLLLGPERSPLHCCAVSRGRTGGNSDVHVRVHRVRTSLHEVLSTARTDCRCDADPHR